MEKLKRPTVSSVSEDIDPTGLSYLLRVWSGPATLQNCLAVSTKMECMFTIQHSNSTPWCITPEMYTPKDIDKNVPSRIIYIRLKWKVYPNDQQQTNIKNRLWQIQTMKIFTALEMRKLPIPLNNIR